MGRCMNMGKCRGIGALAVMEVSRVVGAKTRARNPSLTDPAAAAAGASSRRRNAVEPGGFQIPYLQLRSRTVPMTMRPRSSTAPVNSGRPRRPSVDWDRISRCSSNASSEAVPNEHGRFPSSDLEHSDDSGTSGRYLRCSRGREMTPSSELRVIESGGMESTAMVGSKSRAWKSPEGMPSEAEIEEFFEAAERDEKQRFAQRYNYDIVRDVPLDGRYEWVPLKP